MCQKKSLAHFSHERETSYLLTFGLPLARDPSRGYLSSMGKGTKKRDRLYTYPPTFDDI